MMEFEGWLSTREAAELTGYSVQYVCRLARKGRIKAHQVGHWLIKRESLLDYKRRMDRLGRQKHNSWREDLGTQGRGRRDREESNEDRQSKRVTVACKGGVDAVVKKVFDKLLLEISLELESRRPDVLVYQGTLVPEFAHDVYVETNDDDVEQLVELIKAKLTLKTRIEHLDAMMDELAPRRG